MENTIVENINHKEKNNSRNVVVDILRGLALALVVYGHVIQCYSHSISQYLENPVYLCIYSFHMPLFMFVSGILFKQSLLRSQQLGNIVKKRTVQLLYPYFIWGLVLFIIEFVINCFRFSANELLPNILRITWNSFSPYWFLLCLWISSLIVVVAWYITKREMVWKFLICLIGIIWFSSGLRDRDVWMYMFFVIGIIMSERALAFLDVNVKNNFLCYLLLVVSAGVFIFLNLGVGDVSIKYIAGIGMLKSIDGIRSCILFFLRASVGIFFVIIFVKILYNVVYIRNTKFISLLANSGKYTLQMYLLQKPLVELIGVGVVFVLREYYPDFLKDNMVIYNALSALLACFYFLIIYRIGLATTERRIVSKYMYGNHIFHT